MKKWYGELSLYCAGGTEPAPTGLEGQKPTQSISGNWPQLPG